MVFLTIHGNDSKYFNEYGNFDTIGAYQQTDSPYYNWYRKKENGEFEYWWGFKNLPVCDGNNKQWQQYIYGKNGIIDKWFKLGIDGLRLDVADELTDDFIQNIRNAVKRNKSDGFIIGEVWENAITKEKESVQRKYLLGNGLDSVMNYPFTNAILKYIKFGDYNYFIKTINEIFSQYPKETIFSLMNSLSTHDITRALTLLASEDIVNENNNLIWNIKKDRKWQFEHNNLHQEEYEYGKQLFKLATLIQYFLPGNSCIYYGDEIGMYGYLDPFNRQCFKWDNIDNELHDFFVELGQIKRKNKFLYNANFKFIIANEKILVFERYSENEKMLIYINRTNEKQQIQSIDEKSILYCKNYENNVLNEFGFIILKN